jgi:hypothetical protein
MLLKAQAVKVLESRYNIPTTEARKVADWHYHTDISREERSQVLKNAQSYEAWLEKLEN